MAAQTKRNPRNLSQIFSDKTNSQICILPTQYCKRKPPAKTKTSAHVAAVACGQCSDTFNKFIKSTFTRAHTRTHARVCYLRRNLRRYRPRSRIHRRTVSRCQHSGGCCTGSTSALQSRHSIGRSCPRVCWRRRWPGRPGSPSRGRPPRPPGHGKAFRWLSAGLWGRW